MLSFSGISCLGYKETMAHVRGAARIAWMHYRTGFPVHDIKHVPHFHNAAAVPQMEQSDSTASITIDVITPDHPM